MFKTRPLIARPTRTLLAVVVALAFVAAMPSVASARSRRERVGRRQGHVPWQDVGDVRLHGHEHRHHRARADNINSVLSTRPATAWGNISACTVTPTRTGWTGPSLPRPGNAVAPRRSLRLHERRRRTRSSPGKSQNFTVTAPINTTPTDVSSAWTVDVANSNSGFGRWPPRTAAPPARSTRGRGASRSPTPSCRARRACRRGLSGCEQDGPGGELARGRGVWSRVGHDAPVPTAANSLSTLGRDDVPQRRHVLGRS